MDKWTNVQMGRQAQVERSTRISAIEPSFTINDGLLIYSSEIMELGNLNGVVKLICLKTLLAMAPNSNSKDSILQVKFHEVRTPASYSTTKKPTIP